MELLKSISNLVSRTPPSADKRPPRQQLGGTLRPRTPPYTTRTYIADDTITLFAYPSRGGIIVLERAHAIHFDFLELSRLDPPLRRAADTEGEDAFCQRLLLLGAKWFDSESRYRFMAGLREGNHQSIFDLEEGRRAALSLAERRWVEVGWPSSGGLWVGEWDTNLPGVLEDNDAWPQDAARACLAKDMDELCEILKRFGARFYQTLEEYEGTLHLKAWEWKTEGEVESLQRTW